jgi:hypothetical protein
MQHRHYSEDPFLPFACVAFAFIIFAGERARAVRMPWRIRVGLGGQPGTAISTGMTFETRPRLA